MKTILSIKDLQTHFYNGSEYITPVRNLSLDIMENETIGLVGESGCGKSVTAHSIMRLFSRNDNVRYKGSIDLCGKNILELSDKNLCRVRKNEISMVFQDAQKSLNPLKRIDKQMLQAIRGANKLSKAEGLKRVEELLESCGINDAKEKLKGYPHELSGGMQQRVMIAMAISKNPKLLIADEPTTALDVTTQEQILKLFKQMKDKYKTSILFITHDLAILEGTCDRVAVMYLGEIMEISTTKNIVSSPLHPYTVKLIGSSPSLESRRKTRLETLPGSVEKLTASIKGCPFAKRCDKAMPICHQKHPNLKRIKDNHEVRCFLYEEEKDE